VGIVTDYPVWFLFLCLVTGGLFAFFLYFRTRKNDIAPWLIGVMSALRFFSVSILAFLLLSPLIRKNTEIIEKPLILVAQDNSRSIALGKDSIFYKIEYPDLINQMVKKLEKKYDVVVTSFGEKVTGSLLTSFNQKTTDISEVFTDFYTRYTNRNVGAMILLTDGLYNKGSNPVYISKNMSFPIYTVALGDTLMHKDLILKNIIYNRTAFLGDKFPVEIQVEANQCNGNSTEVSIYKGSQLIDKRKITFSGNKAFQKITMILEAKEKGVHHYSILMTPVEKEINLQNNRFDLFVDVIDTRQKIAVLYGSPHPDITAIRQALEGLQKYEITLKKISEFTDFPEKYDLVILYQLPSLSEINNLKGFLSAKTALLFIIGTQTDLNSFNSLKTGMQITTSRNSFAESLPSLNPDFSLFTTDKSLTAAVADFPPLFCPFGTYQYSPVSEVLFYQKIGNVISKMPQILFVDNGGKKCGIITGENLWKWRLANYLQKANHQQFDELINKIVQYLTVKEDRSLFRVKCRDRFQENEMVGFDAGVYNESYEMINQQDVNLTITDEQNKSYPFVFSKTDKAYFLNAGTFPVGKYTYAASVKTGKNLFQKNGSFIVAPLNLETTNTVADHNLLYRLAKEHNGEMFYPKNLDALIGKINGREDIKPVIYNKKQFTDLTGNLWVFLIILSLLAAEWFLRKRSGIY
jgi:hypothetical protein